MSHGKRQLLTKFPLHTFILCNLVAASLLVPFFVVLRHNHRARVFNFIYFCIFTFQRVNVANSLLHFFSFLMFFWQILRYTGKQKRKTSLRDSYGNVKLTKNNNYLCWKSFAVHFFCHFLKLTANQNSDTSIRK